MKIRRKALGRTDAVILSLMMTFGWGIVYGQNFPSKPIRIVTAAVGGDGDYLSRSISPDLAAQVGEPVVVDNRPGSGAIAAEFVAKAPADGYTLLLYGSIIWLAPFLQKHVSWDPQKDFAPITLATTSPTILVVHPSLPVRSVKELIALAKNNPGQLNYGSGGTGSATQIATELFKSMAGVRIEHIPYKGNGVAINNLIAGEVQVMFATPAETVPQVKAGKLIALAVTSAEPSVLLPGLPTVASSGLPGYEAVSIFGVFSPAKTPREVVNRLNLEIVKILNKAEVKQRLFNLGVDAEGSSPEQFAAKLQSEMDKWGKVIKDAGIQPE